MTAATCAPAGSASTPADPVAIAPTPPAPVRAPLPPHGPLLDDWRAFVRRTPDWWLGAASLLAWMALTAMFLAMATGSLHSGHGDRGTVGSAAATSYGALL